MTAIQWQSYGIILTFTLLCEQSAKSVKTDGVTPFSFFAAYGGGTLPHRD